jgi:hypothetical protein
MTLANIATNMLAKAIMDIVGLLISIPPIKPPKIIRIIKIATKKLV